jgi:UDP-N-acetylglucosamine 2-epimerase
VDPTRKLLLVTAHRRESFGAPFIELCHALRAIADEHDDVQILYPVHLNPNVFDVVYRLLDGHPRITLCEPLDYLPFVAAMKRSFLVLTDSGGVQEEAPSLVCTLNGSSPRPIGFCAIRMPMPRWLAVSHPMGTDRPPGGLSKFSAQSSASDDQGVTLPGL